MALVIPGLYILAVRLNTVLPDARVRYLSVFINPDAVPMHLVILEPAHFVTVRVDNPTPSVQFAIAKLAFPYDSKLHDRPSYAPNLLLKHRYILVIIDLAYVFSTETQVDFVDLVDISELVSGYTQILVLYEPLYEKCPYLFPK